MNRSAKLVLVAALGTALAACGQAATAPGVPAPVLAKAGTDLAAVVLEAVEAPALGKIVSDGKTLYRFDKDTAKPPTSNCAGDCATAWPPVLVSDVSAVSAAAGIDKSLLGTLARPEGNQLTIAGWPAYHYSKDTTAGDVKGQGAGGTWFAFTPEGKKASAQVPGAPVTVTVMKVGKLGPIVTDRGGMTLYRFDKDTASPSKSNCAGDCAKKWPPLLVPAGAAVEGLDPAVLGTVDRGDGTRQVTVGGWPVYHFSEDKVPCDTKGQGVGGTWFTLTATGKKAGV
ncbi:hypothetical protein [Actinokineospora enzanensis]|uniref:hypothetical protein n=1 Tax=Actinokineospora enzanensis TaxID=155975 RepID=UPI00035DAE36|nr:hypothetical protein [Actinokineospora enzanensis]